MKMEFLGMEVEGSGGSGEEGSRPEQLSIDEFKKMVQRILDHPEVTRIAWTQYTPYFNDGEPCVFHAGEPYFSFTGVDTSEDEDCDYSWMADDLEEGIVWCGAYNNRDVFEKIVGKTEKKYGPWTGNYRTREWTWKEGSGPENSPNPSLFTAITEFSRFLEGGNFDHAVEDLFGDHATVRIDKLAGKVVIDEYDHS